MRLLSHATTSVLLVGTFGIMGLTGCKDESPPPPRVPVPTYNAQDRRDSVSQSQTESKPLPPPRTAAPGAYPPFDDVPLVSQQAPETPVFIDAYRRVGSPRIVIFVNRTFDALPTSDSHTEDEVSAKALDYEAMETIMTDWLACNGQVMIISPVMARQRAGSSELTFEMVQQLGADILVRVQAHPTKQTPAGLEVRIVAEALNVKGGQSIGRAVVDVPPPLEKTKINTYTRFMARKLMDGMIGSWLAPPPQGAPGAAPPTPQGDAPRTPATQP